MAVPRQAIQEPAKRTSHEALGHWLRRGDNLEWPGEAEVRVELDDWDAVRLGLEQAGKVALPIRRPERGIEVQGNRHDGIRGRPKVRTGSPVLPARSAMTGAEQPVA